jgi:hypothetical protein
VNLTLRIHSTAGTVTHYLPAVASRADALSACDAYCADAGIPARPLTCTETETGFVCEYVVEMAVAS